MGSSEADLDAAVAMCNAAEGNCQRVWFQSESPQRKVFVDSFAISKKEITNAQYQQCVASGSCSPPHIDNDNDSDFQNENLSSFSGGNQPVVGVSWQDANNYCQWIGARLPTEAEWEKAARSTDGRYFPWGNSFDSSRANSCDANCPFEKYKVAANNDGFARTAPVGSFPNGASHYGVMDMAGNVFEWVADWYGAYPGSAQQSEFFGQKYRVLRGGGWSKFDFRGRVTDRGSFARPDFANYDIGFRCAK
jgi:formylglycine-generating enzyme required for sulfatase activity